MRLRIDWVGENVLMLEVLVICSIFRWLSVFGL